MIGNTEYSRWFKYLFGCLALGGGIAVLSRACETDPKDYIVPAPESTKIELKKHSLGYETYHNADLCSLKLKPGHSRKQIEEMVEDADTPQKAFEKIANSFTFDGGLLETRKFPLGRCGRWYSLQEFLAYNIGICIDGAISFLALLSDNPEYEGRLILFDSEDAGHAIAVFREDGKYGYASFNDYEDKISNSQFMPGCYDTIEALLKDKMGMFDGYGEVSIGAEKLKFGEGMLEQDMIKGIQFKKIKK